MAAKKEEWRSVPGWPNYEVSNLGRVKRVKEGPGTWTGRVLRPDRQERVKLFRGGVPTIWSIKGLLRLAFDIDTPSAKCKLSVAQVYAIRADGRPAREVARDYGVTVSNVYCIRRRSSWKHLPEVRVRKRA